MSTTAVKERPILFSAPMVRAILAGEKTQTRRIIKPQPEHGVERCWYTGSGWAFGAKDGACSCAEVPCKFIAGQRLWVRETWGYFGGAEYLYQRAPESVGYAATHSELQPIPGGKWRPSIHMPRWASRITLEITEVRVQRLQEISEADAKAEGVEASTAVEMKDGSPCYSLPFQLLWTSIHGSHNPNSWDSNPFVWAITFKRI